MRLEIEQCHINISIRHGVHAALVELVASLALQNFRQTLDLILPGRARIDCGGVSVDPHLLNSGDGDIVLSRDAWLVGDILGLSSGIRSV